MVSHVGSTSASERCYPTSSRNRGRSAKPAFRTFVTRERQTGAQASMPTTFRTGQRVRHRIGRPATPTRRREMVPILRPELLQKLPADARPYQRVSKVRSWFSMLFFLLHCAGHSPLLRGTNEGGASLKTAGIGSCFQSFCVCGPRMSASIQKGCAPAHLRQGWHGDQSHRTTPKFEQRIEFVLNRDTSPSK